MPRRTRDSLYAGALGRIDAARIARLSPGHVLQPKRDGIYALVSTDSTGRIANMLMRSGAPVPRQIAADFRGVRWVPNSLAVAELEAFTEASDRLVATRGYRNAPVFDALRVAGQDVTSLPQSARRDAIVRAVEQLPDDRPWRDEPSGARRPDGPWTRRVPVGQHRLPLVPELPISAYSSAMSEWVDTGDAEGLVVVAQSAPIGKGKRKHKTTDTLDAVVLDRDKSAARLGWNGTWFVVSAQGAKWAGLRVGDCVEVLHSGWEERVLRPKHPRLLRLRPDKVAA